MLILERTRYGDWRPGESLPPSANAALADLGLIERLSALGWRKCFGIQACWGGDEPYALDFIFDPHGAGVQVERPGFDVLLASAAVDAGATLAVESRLLDFERCATGWYATIARSGRECRYQVRFLVDASGRRAAVARRIGARVQMIDRLVGLIGLFEETEHDGVDSTLLLEAVEDGWWYSVPVAGSLVAAFMTDADLLRVRKRLAPAILRDRLGHARRTAALVDGCSLRELRVRSATSSRLSQAAGEGWLAVGDAAAAYDPLSGIGLTSALESGMRAGRAIAAALDGDRRATARYAMETARSWRLYLGERAETYARERRWSDAPFWARRTAVS